MRLTRLYGDETLTLEIDQDANGWKIALPDGSIHHLSDVESAQNTLSFQVSSPELEGVRSLSIPFHRVANDLHIAYQGETYTFQTPTPNAKTKKGSIASGVLTAPMAGVLVDVLVKPGDVVEAYQVVAVIEAMKIMSRLEAGFAGVVRAVHFQKGQQITHGASVVEIEPTGSEPGGTS